MASVTSESVPQNAEDRGTWPRGGEGGRTQQIEGRGGRGGRVRGFGRGGGERGMRWGGRGRGRGGDARLPLDPDPSNPLQKPLKALSVSGSPKEDAEELVCFICANPVVYHSIAPCGHSTCHICSLRMRALYGVKACAHCRVNACFHFDRHKLTRDLLPDGV